MDDEERRYLQELLHTHQRRLSYLQERSDSAGSSPQIYTLQGEISEIEERLQNENTHHERLYIVSPTDPNRSSATINPNTTITAANLADGLQEGQRLLDEGLIDHAIELLENIHSYLSDYTKDNANHPLLLHTYQQALEPVLARLGSDHSHYDELLVYEHRLLENTIGALRYGDTTTSRADRAQIIDSLNSLLLQEIGISFTELIGGDNDSQNPKQKAKQLYIESFYKKGFQAYINGDYVTARSAFEQVVSVRRLYKNTEILLYESKRIIRLRETNEKYGKIASFPLVIVFGIAGFIVRLRRWWQHVISSHPWLAALLVCLRIFLLSVGSVTSCLAVAAVATVMMREPIILNTATQIPALSVTQIEATLTISQPVELPVTVATRLIDPAQTLQSTVISITVPQLIATPANCGVRRIAVLALNVRDRPAGRTILITLYQGKLLTLTCESQVVNQHVWVKVQGFNDPRINGWVREDFLQQP